MGTGAGIPNDVTTLVFDVMGTVVDVDGTGHTYARSVLGDSGLSPVQVFDLVDDVKERHAELMKAVVEDQAPYQSHRQLRRLALLAAVDQAGLQSISGSTLEQLTAVISFSDPWPDSPPALARLRAALTVVALSNADVEELAGLSQHAGLAWHTVLSGQFFQQFKPNPAVYAGALELLAVDVQRVMFVASHPWDLRAAADAGMATCLVHRPDTRAALDGGSGDEFTLDVADLTELADLVESASA